MCQSKFQIPDQQSRAGAALLAENSQFAVQRLAEIISQFLSCKRRGDIAGLADDFKLDLTIPEQFLAAFRSKNQLAFSLRQIMELTGQQQGAAQQKKKTQTKIFGAHGRFPENDVGL